MNPTLKAALALIFVAVLGFVLLQPVLDSTGDMLTDASLPEVEPEPQETKPAEEEPSPTPSDEPEPAPSPETRGAITGAFRTQPLFDRYFDFCLRDQGITETEALLATVTGRKIGFGTTAGPTNPGPPGGTRPTPAKRFLGFNLSRGLYAASNGNGVVIAAPEGIQGADGDASGSVSIIAVAWSPTSSCGLFLGRDGSLNDDNGMLVREDVEDVAFSPDGRRMAVVLREGAVTSVWVADLAGTRMREIQRERSGARVTLKAWSADGRTLYLTTTPGNALSFVSTTGTPPQSGRLGAEAVTDFEQCSGRLLGIINGGIAEISRQGADYLTDPDSGYTEVSCSPDGGFLAAIRSDDLVLLDRNGGLVRDLTTDTGFRDIYADWGPQGAGLVLGRVPTGDGDAQVWFIPEGGTARRTGLVYTPGPGAIDWSATPPTGLAQR